MPADSKKRHTDIVKSIAKDLGFLSCGVSEATFLEEEAPRLESWLKNGYHGEMAYMENHFEKRLDPRKLVPGARSVVSLTYNYFQKDWSPNREAKISQYAAGIDYHYVIKDKLKLFMDRLNDEIGEVGGRVFVDSAPVLERAWAAKSGLGWVAKNSMLLSKSKGSFFFLAQLIIDLDLEPDKPVTDHCGTCTACIDACPTDAIIGDAIIDSNKCISYLTIELRNEIPSGFEDKMEGWVFGCDICQDVCPWNRFSKQTTEPNFVSNGFEKWEREEWLELTNSVFRKKFGSSPIKRTGIKGMKRNVRYLNSDR